MKNASLLAQHLRAAMDAELTRSVHPDPDLVAAYTDMILDLDNIEPETDEEVRAGIDNVLRKHALMRKRRRWRPLLIAAIVALLIASVSAAMIPMGTNDESLLKKWMPYLVQQGPGSKIDFGDYLTLGNNGEALQYKSIRQFVRKTGADVLVPTMLPQGYRVREVLLSTYYQPRCPYVIFVMNDPETQGIFIMVGYTNEHLKEMEMTEQIGGYFCGVSEFNGGYQCCFNHDGNAYTVNAKTLDDLRLIVEHMRSGSEVYGTEKK